MSAYRSQADLVNEALNKLGVASAGVTVNSEDYERVAGTVDSMVRRLAGLEIVYVPDTSNIPGEWLDDLAAILAGMCASGFGSAPEDRDSLINLGLGGAGPVPIGAGQAARALKIMNRGRPTYEPLRTESF